MKFLIVGHPRTGTKYMSELFKKLGFSVGHEVLLSNGTSNWLYACNDTPPKSWTDINSKIVTHAIEQKKRDETLYDYKLCVVRNPVKALQSIICTENINKVSMDYRLRNLIGIEHGCNETELAIQIFVKWYELIESQLKLDSVIHIENAYAETTNFLNKFNINYQHPLNLPSEKHNTRRHKLEYSEINFKTVREQYINLLNSYCQKYGYDKI